MKPITLLQVSGPDRTGKSTFLKTLGLSALHFPKPLSHKTPVGTLHSMSAVMTEYAAPSQCSVWGIKLQAWDRGLIEPFVYDTTRGNLFSEAWLKACYDVSVDLLGTSTQVFFVTTDAIAVEAKDAEDIYYRQFADMIRERYLRAATLLRQWGAEVFTFRNFADTTPPVLIRDWCRKGKVCGRPRLKDGTIDVG